METVDYKALLERITTIKSQINQLNTEFYDTERIVEKRIKKISGLFLIKNEDRMYGTADYLFVDYYVIDGEHIAVDYISCEDKRYTDTVEILFDIEYLSNPYLVEKLEKEIEQLLIHNDEEDIKQVEEKEYQEYLRLKSKYEMK